MKRVYIPKRQFWVRRRLLRVLRHVLGTAAVLVSAALTLGILWGMALRGGPPGNRVHAITGADVAGRFDMVLTNRFSDALEGIQSIRKVYWISDEDLVAPEPDQSRFGQTEDAAVLESVLTEAEELLQGQELYFDPYRERRPGSTVQYYLDETILVITWKEVHDHCVYTFSEVKIAHPSQIRRFLAGGEYGTAQQFLTTEMSASVNAVMASSGDFYAHRNYGAVVYGGEVCRSHNGQLDLCFVDENGDLRFLYANEVPGEQGLRQYVQDNGIRFSLAFGPVIVDEYQRVTPAWYPVGENAMEYSRAALCQMGQLHYLVAAANMELNYPFVPTLFEFARQIQQTGCRMAYTLDGGQTATIVMNDTLVNQVSYGSQRRISDILYFATAVPDGG